jgi:[protein-PII] uridylyltransferase
MSVARLKPARIEHVVDGLRLRAQLSAAYQSEGDNARPRVRALLHGALFRGRMIAKERLEAGENGLAVARLLAAVADEVVSALYDYTTTHIFRARNPTEGERFAVVAVGGYGRGELAPSSDLDLLFLRAYKQTPFSESVTEYMLYMLWDMGLKVGHASRNVDESLKLAREDHTIRTAILEARRLAGDASLFEELATRFRKDVAERDQAGFIAAKLKERDERHQRIGATRYMVEPNVKEGKGGLRDLHTLFWLARHRYGFTQPRDYVEAGVFTVEEERNAFRRAAEFLWTVRCHLHFITGRAEEKLTFDLQPELAKRLGYGARANHTAVERFMKRYFLVAKEVGALTRVLCAKLEADNAKNAPKGMQRLFPAAKKRQRRSSLAFTSKRAGSTSIRPMCSRRRRTSFVCSRSPTSAISMCTRSLGGRRARRVRALSPAWRKDGESRAAFPEVATSKSPGAALRLMNEAGVLGKFLPEFGRIVAQMQFNMYHHYTVDEHTLQAIDAMSEIEHGRHKDQHPLATEIFSKIINRRALYLAMLLHDTGKGEGDQQIEGEKSARAACERLGLPQEEVDLVGWLVGNHLVMSDVAQKRDIGDPRTVAQFAKIVGSVERLRLLLVLTVSDIRAVGPSVWNDWKGQLLRDLYRLTEAALHGGRSDEEGVREHLAEIAGEAKARLLKDHRCKRGVLDGVARCARGRLLAQPRRRRAAWHALEVMRAARESDPACRGAHSPDAGHHGSSRLCRRSRRACSRAWLRRSPLAAQTLPARACTRQRWRGVRRVLDPNHGPQAVRRTISALEALWSKAHARRACNDHAAPPPAAPSRRNAAFAIEPWVRIDNDMTPHATVIEASGRDRLGLLADLAHVCAEAKVSIGSAHIDTYGERASDVFYVQEEEGGGQIANPRRIASVRAKLEDVLRAAEPAAPADPAKAPLAVARASTAR